MVDPKSVAGVLIREYDSPEQAFRYAGSLFDRLSASGSELASDYAEASKQIERMIMEGAP